jgi:hypothetical protein
MPGSFTHSTIAIEGLLLPYPRQDIVDNLEGRCHKPIIRVQKVIAWIKGFK